MLRPGALTITILVATVARADAPSEMNAAQACLDRSDYACAVTHYATARDLSPSSTGPWLGLGLAHAAAGQCDLAVIELEEYLRRKPARPNPGAQSRLVACRSQLEARKKPTSTIKDEDVDEDDEEALARAEKSSSPKKKIDAMTDSAEGGVVGGTVSRPPERIVVTFDPYGNQPSVEKPPMKGWKKGLIAGSILVGIGLTITGIVIGVERARGTESSLGLATVQ